MTDSGLYRRAFERNALCQIPCTSSSAAAKIPCSANDGTWLQRLSLLALFATKFLRRAPEATKFPADFPASQGIIWCETGSPNTASSASHFSFLYQYLIYLRRSRHFRALGRIGSSVEARQVPLTGCFRRIFRAQSLSRIFQSPTWSSALPLKPMVGVPAST